MRTIRHHGANRHPSWSSLIDYIGTCEHVYRSVATRCLHTREAIQQVQLELLLPLRYNLRPQQSAPGFLPSLSSAYTIRLTLLFRTSYTPLAQHGYYVPVPICIPKLFNLPPDPPELVLKTIQHLPFNDGSLITTIRNAHPRLRAIFQNYERSMTRNFMKKELRHAETDFGCQNCRLNVDWLANCVRSYDIVDDVMDALCSEHNFNAVLRHNVSLANAGLLLLYRIVSIESHTERLSYIKHLPRDPLTAIYLVLHHATLSARYHGSGWINQRTYGRFMDANQLSLRCELEFCFAEAALSLGPEYISDTLLHHETSDAETTLLNFYLDHGTHDWEWPCWGQGKGEFEPPRTHGPVREKGVGRSLFTTLLERLAEVMECGLEDVRPRVEQHLESAEHELAYLSLGGKARLLEGRDVECGNGQ